jgi:hypothetical protein
MLVLNYITSESAGDGFGGIVADGTLLYKRMGRVEVRPNSNWVGGVPTLTHNHCRERIAVNAYCAIIAAIFEAMKLKHPRQAKPSRVEVSSCRF